MDYEKAYKEAKKRGKEALLRCRQLSTEANMAVAYALDYVFGETKESEDERIRKELIEQVAYIIPDSTEVDAFGNTLSGYYKRIEKYRAYLEKLGERKYLYYDQGFVEGMRQSKALANAEIIVSPPKMTNKVSVSEELYEHIRETCACIDDAMSSETLVDITDYLEMADKSAQAAFDMLEKEQQPAEWSEEDEKRVVELKTFIAKCNGFNKANRQKAFELIDSLRPQPHWKPSEYTLSLVKKVADGKMLTHMEQMAMETLYDDLQKLL